MITKDVPKNKPADEPTPVNLDLGTVADSPVGDGLLDQIDAVISDPGASAPATPVAPTVAPPDPTVSAEDRAEAAKAQAIANHNAKLEAAKAKPAAEGRMVVGSVTPEAVAPVAAAVESMAAPIARKALNAVKSNVISLSSVVLRTVLAAADIYVKTGTVKHKKAYLASRALLDAVLKEAKAAETEG